MRFLIFCILLLVIPFLGLTQNLVLNPCFDQGDCVQTHDKRVGFIQSGWTRNGRKMDIFFETYVHENGWEPFHLPDICDIYDETYYRPQLSQVMQPVCGNFFGYIGLIHSHFDLEEENEYHQALFGELVEELKPDSIYYFSTFHTNQAARTRSTDNLKVVLATDSTGMRTENIIDIELIPGANTIYERDSGDYVISFGRWSQWESCFQANGGEKFISFLAGLPHGMDSLYRIPEELVMDQSDEIPKLYERGSVENENLIGYIDAVRIEQLPSRIPPVSLSFCKNSCRQLKLDQLPEDPRFRTADSIVWKDGVKGLLRTFPDSGTYVVSLHAQCGVTKVAFDVELQSCALDTVRYELRYCASDCYELFDQVASDSLFSAAEKVYWSDGEEVFYRQFSDTGQYKGVLILECAQIPIVVDVTSEVCRPLPSFWSVELCADEPHITEDSLPASMLGWEADHWQWDTGESLSDREFFDIGRYILVGIRSCATRSVEVDVSLKDCEERVFIPNVFSPNGDGVNDRWEYTIDNITFLSVEVYDRQGSRVFFSRSAGEYWDGYIGSRGDRAPSGVYVYLFNYRGRNGDIKQKVGTITLLR
jgi:gliding motility-associated-like protein